MKESVLYNQGFARKAKGYDVQPSVECPNEFLPATTLADRLESGVCELCGKENEVLYMHHVRMMSCLDKNTPWGRQMLKRRRKTLAVCKTCMDIINQNRQ